MPGEQNLLRSCEICGEPAAPEPTVLEPGTKTTDQYGREILTRRTQAWYCPAHRQRTLNSTPTPAPPRRTGARRPTREQTSLFDERSALRGLDR